jgi:hypothetical protein
MLGADLDSPELLPLAIMYQDPGAFKVGVKSERGLLTP